MASLSALQAACTGEENSIGQKNTQSKEQTVHIVGTAHVSKKSCDVVQRVIRDVKPEAIFLELCNARSTILKPPQIDKMKEPDLNAALMLWRKGQATLFEALYSWMLARFGSEMETFPGEEFRVAFEESKRIGARVMLGDRPINVTVKRMWSGLSFWEKCRLCWYIVVTGINIPDKDEMLKLFSEWEETDAITEAIRELSASFPSIGVQLIDERNLYMIHNLRELSHQASSIVAVVGAGHLPGIKENWNKEIDIEQVSHSYSFDLGSDPRLCDMTDQCVAFEENVTLLALLFDRIQCQWTTPDSLMTVPRFNLYTMER